MRPTLKPGLRRLWRDTGSLQFGIEPALVLRGLGPAEAAFVLGLDGTADRPTAISRAAASGVDPDLADQLLRWLTEHDLLEDAALDRTHLRRLSRLDRERLGPDLTALSLTRPGPGEAARALLRRRDAAVAVEGAGRVGAAVVGLLAAAGVGSVLPVDPRPVGPHDLTPGGPGPAELGLRRDDAAFAAARRLAPDVRRDTRAPVSVTVLAPDGAVDPARRAQLNRSALAHVPVTVLEGTATIGPFVRPGLSPCLHCVELHHTDRDPQWPLLLAQLVEAPASSAACDVTVAALAAAVTARLVLADLDAGPDESVRGSAAAYVVAVADLLPRPLAYPFHPACGCRWDKDP